MMTVAVVLIGGLLLAEPFVPATAAGAPMPGSPIDPKISKTDPVTPETWQQRQEKLLKAQQTAQQLEALRAQMNRPTAWQLQNPSGLQNRSPTEPTRGYVAPNTYFGPENRSWSNLSAPLSMPQVPANYFTPPQAIFSDSQLAPNTYWGTANQSWSNVRSGSATPSGLGGWNYGP